MEPKQVGERVRRSKNKRIIKLSYRVEAAYKKGMAEGIKRSRERFRSLLFDLKELETALLAEAKTGEVHCGMRGHYPPCDCGGAAGDR